MRAAGRNTHRGASLARASLSPTSRVNWWQAARLSAAEATDHCLQNSSLFIYLILYIKDQNDVSIFAGANVMTLIAEMGVEI